MSTHLHADKKSFGRTGSFAITNRGQFPILARRRRKISKLNNSVDVNQNNDARKPPIPTLDEVDEERPETPIVKTRHERFLLTLDGKRGNGRPSLPHDTKDIFSSDGMYMRRLQATPASSRKLTKSGHRCPTPVPFEQPLTKLCWENGNKEAESSDSEEDFSPGGYRVPFTPRNQVTNPLLKQLRDKYDVKLSEFDNDIDLPEEKPEQLNLTEHVIQNYFQKKVDNNKRIVKWLVECEEKKNSTQLPAHLPDITYRTVHVWHE